LALSFSDKSSPFKGLKILMRSKPVICLLGVLISSFQELPFPEAAENVFLFPEGLFSA
jgi:hypothetical protein